MIRQAIDSDVHIIGISTLAGGHNGLIPELTRLLKEQNITDKMIVVGGVIPEKDHPFLKKNGVSFIFGPGTKLTIAAANIIDNLLAQTRP